MTTLLIAGASVRAAVHSARRSGKHRLLGADLFNDQDLQACESWQLDSRYETLSDLAASERPDFWMYTGALENHPSVIAGVSRHASLLGTDASTAQRIRQPSNVARVLTESNLPCPEFRTDVCPRDGNWLRKPYRSAAGLGIRPATPGELNGRSGTYFQRLVVGSPCSAVFLACQRTAQLLGVTRQLIGDAGYGATGFQYCGSIGPLPLNENLTRQWERLGNCLTSAFELKGLFGIDAITCDGQIVPLEVNPRYTASIEILEAGQTWSSIDLHIAACRNERPLVERSRSKSPWFGKAIVFAGHQSMAGEELIEWIHHVNHQPDGPHVADIPRANTPIGVGHPIVTVLARGETNEGVASLLQHRAADVVTRLRTTTTNERR